MADLLFLTTVGVASLVACFAAFREVPEFIAQSLKRREESNVSSYYMSDTVEPNTVVMQGVPYNITGAPIQIGKKGATGQPMFRMLIQNANTLEDREIEFEEWQLRPTDKVAAVLRNPCNFELTNIDDYGKLNNEMEKTVAENRELHITNSDLRKDYKEITKDLVEFTADIKRSSGAGMGGGGFSGVLPDYMRDYGVGFGGWGVGSPRTARPSAPMPPGEPEVYG